LFHTIGGVGGAALKPAQLVIKLRAGAAGLIEHRALQKKRVIPGKLALLCRQPMLVKSAIYVIYLQRISREEFLR
jgi:hypothetical protein